jgi:hypothetical protein
MPIPLKIAGNEINNASTGGSREDAQSGVRWGNPLVVDAPFGKAEFPGHQLPQFLVYGCE